MVFVQIVAPKHTQSQSLAEFYTKPVKILCKRESFPCLLPPQRLSSQFSWVLGVGVTSHLFLLTSGTPTLIISELLRVTSPAAPEWSLTPFQSTLKEHNTHYSNGNHGCFIFPQQYKLQAHWNLPNNLVHYSRSLTWPFDTGSILRACPDCWEISHDTLRPHSDPTCCSMALLKAIDNSGNECVWVARIIPL